MARVIYDTGSVVQDFRAQIRPSLVGRLGRIEPQIAARARRELFEWLLEVVNQALRTTPIRSRTGAIGRQLRTGIRVVGAASLRTMQGKIWTQPWVFPHEYGATIQPKESPWLAIPFAYGVHPDGRPKFRSPGAWKRYGSFVFTRKEDQKKFIVYKSGGRLKFLYVLVDQVEIPARLGLNRTADSKLGQLLGEFGVIYMQEAWPALDAGTAHGFRL
jgi:hypothetical protein